MLTFEERPEGGDRLNYTDIVDKGIPGVASVQTLAQSHVQGFHGKCVRSSVIVADKDRRVEAES